MINLLNVLGRLVELEPAQGELLDKICAGSLLSFDELTEAGAFELPEDQPKKPTELVAEKKEDTRQGALFAPQPNPKKSSPAPKKKRKR